MELNNVVIGELSPQVRNHEIDLNHESDGVKHRVRRLEDNQLAQRAWLSAACAIGTFIGGAFVLAIKVMFKL